MNIEFISDAYTEDGLKLPMVYMKGRVFPMEYCSTRNQKVRVSAAWAISHGISEEGGLFVPCSFPQIPAGELEAMPLIKMDGSRVLF